MEFFAKNVNEFQLLPIFTKASILDVWQGSEYISGIDTRFWNAFANERWFVNPLSAKPTKWSNTLKQFVDKLLNCLSLFNHFVKLALKRLILFEGSQLETFIGQ